jgi:growth hormone-inducible transmembrane protein
VGDASGIRTKGNAKACGGLQGQRHLNISSFIELSHSCRHLTIFVFHTPKARSSNMSFILRRPFAVSAGLKQMSKSSLTVRLFHNSPLKSKSFLISSTKPSPSNALKSKTAFQSAFKRAYTPPQAYQVPTGNLTQKLLYGAALVAGTIVATNLIFNRETREDGGMPPFEREYLNQTFLHTGLGVGIIGVAASALHRSGWSYRLMATNPWLVIGVSLATSIGTMYATFHTDPNK